MWMVVLLHVEVGPGGLLLGGLRLLHRGFGGRGLLLGDLLGGGLRGGFGLGLLLDGHFLYRLGRLFQLLLGEGGDGALPASRSRTSRRRASRSSSVFTGGSAWGCWSAWAGWAGAAGSTVVWPTWISAVGAGMASGISGAASGWPARVFRSFRASHSLSAGVWAAGVKAGVSCTGAGLRLHHRASPQTRGWG